MDPKSADELHAEELLAIGGIFPVGKPQESWNFAERSTKGKVSKIFLNN